MTIKPSIKDFCAEFAARDNQGLSKALYKLADVLEKTLEKRVTLGDAIDWHVTNSVEHVRMAADYLSDMTNQKR